MVPSLNYKVTISGESSYIYYVYSDYLNQHVRGESTYFDIVEDVEDILTEVCFKGLRKAVLARTKEYLQDLLTENELAASKFESERKEKVTKVTSK